jgi:hypothetical protein
MLKFRCQHCGQRIAVPARHLGKLVTCAECGQVTHPLAEQIVRAGPSRTAAPTVAAAVAASPVKAGGICGNCGGPIGALQAEHRWRDRKVCAPCFHLLTAESSAPEGRAIQAVVSRVPAPVEQPAAPALPVRERATRALMVFVVAVVALYGALTLLRDIAGLVAVAAVAVLALLALYAAFRARVSARVKPNGSALPSA